MHAGRERMRQSAPSAALVVALELLLSDSPAAAQAVRVVHVFVALADNQHQGIIPVPLALGNGRDPIRNLPWERPSVSRLISKRARSGS
jgi:hypothetical protein